jgi:hypothetical protein
MCPSTETTDGQDLFALHVLRNLLQHIDEENSLGSSPFLVSHAWAEGPVIYLVYKAPPNKIIWGLARDTRQSLIDRGPWLSLDDAVRYYYLLDLDEGRMSADYPHPGDPETILWDADVSESLPVRPSDISETHRYTPTTTLPPPGTRRYPPPTTEPRRYADPCPQCEARRDL